LLTKGKRKVAASGFTERECDDILKKFGFRPATPEESRVLREAEARTKAKQAKQAKRLIAV